MLMIPMIILLLITLALYVVSAIVVWRGLTRAQAVRWQWLLPFAALLCHAGLLWNYLKSDDFDHLNITSSLSTVAFLLSALTLVKNKRANSLLLRPIIYIFAAVSLVLMVASPVNWGASVDIANGLAIHIVLSLLAYAVLVLASLYAVQILYLTYLLKHHRSNLLTGYFPPLMTVERYFFRLVATGTLMLLLAISSGFIFLDNMFEQGQAHKTILTFIALIIYAMVLFFHRVRKVRGRSLVIASVVGSGILTLAYFGSRVVRDILLSM
ncbi:ABC-type uncharacterized transport system permease subunit [Pseudidiomarina tainanensis]|uniref:ABC-type uncharacterized transport system permease subunit n=3 Tax=Pseudidiomarina TaxID=2800384 RepID=A0A368US23_9GAMM|nr:ABC-type uncharacterized transport system permease subunit [Pseudidiomarina maritima]RBP88939.1 ABC-type uncharacterized transport system permease subunit [Pseudidiomarina tainanensis]RCW30925.1 ABC-type uncharacterized transport system permease subunit [Pseudidiomarina tainanensis]